jgi:2-oxoisovalerate dehydrogenase E1 component
VAQKGGVYTVTKGLQKAFGPRRVFNTLLDETMILGMAQGFANMGMLPIPEIQYLAYFHNACDQIRGEAARCSSSATTSTAIRWSCASPAGLPAWLRRALPQRQLDHRAARHPGLVVGCPSRGDDAATMLRTLTALAKVDGRVSVFLEPIALYMTKDLYEAGDGQWLTTYPSRTRRCRWARARLRRRPATW